MALQGTGRVAQEAAISDIVRFSYNSRRHPLRPMREEGRIAKSPNVSPAASVGVEREREGGRKAWRPWVNLIFSSTCLLFQLACSPLVYFAASPDCCYFCLFLYGKLPLSMPETQYFLYFFIFLGGSSEAEVQFRSNQIAMAVIGVVLQY